MRVCPGRRVYLNIVRNAIQKAGPIEKYFVDVGPAFIGIGKGHWFTGEKFYMEIKSVDGHAIVDHNGIAPNLQIRVLYREAIDDAIEVAKHLEELEARPENDECQSTSKK